MNFDRIAVAYDFLTKFVFGRSIQQSQIIFFPDISANSKILIIGGGTGWILNHLPSSSRVTYIEPSLEMTKLAHKVRPQLNVEFITEKLEDASIEKKFDVIITNFFLDLFSENECASTIQKLRNRLVPEGKWFVTDFQNDGAWWQKVMLGIMYFFFRLTTDLKTGKLPNWQNMLKIEGMKVIRRHEYYKRFIVSVELESR